MARRISRIVQVSLPNDVAEKVERISRARFESVSHFLRKIILLEVATYHIPQPRPKRPTTGGTQ
jgi:hypothetical protein